MQKEKDGTEDGVGRVLWSTCVLAERRGAAADGFWKTEDVCVPFVLLLRALWIVCA